MAGVSLHPGPSKSCQLPGVWWDVGRQAERLEGHSETLMAGTHGGIQVCHNLHLHFIEKILV